MLALRTLDGLTPSGAKTRIELSIGVPHPSGTSFRCLVRVSGLDYDYTPPDIGGWDPLQAVLASVSLCASLLDDFVVRGGQLYYPDSSDRYDLSDFAVSFRRASQT